MFDPVEETELPHAQPQFNLAELNPHPKPSHTFHAFGDFEVDKEDKTIGDIRKNNPGMGFEYASLYNLASHLYDTAF